MVERWFPDADTNTVLLLLERCSDAEERETADIRFVRLRRPLAQLFPGPEQEGRRQALEDLVDSILTGPTGEEDPRWVIHSVAQGTDGGLSFVEISGAGSEDLLNEEGEDE